MRSSLPLVRARAKAPVAGERAQPLVELHLTGLRVVMGHQGAGVVQQHFFGHPAEVAKRPFHAVEPGALALMVERLHVAAPGVPERGHPHSEQGAETRSSSPPISTRRVPKSICSCCPGAVSKRTVARAAAASSRRSGAQARSTVRSETAT
jgi:hypothetical protein